RTFNAAASPPDVHQCSIWTSLLSAADALPETPSAPTAIALATNIVRNIIVYPPYPLFPPETFRLRIQKPLPGSRFLKLSGPSLELPAPARASVDVERLFLVIVVDRVAAEFAADARLPIAEEGQLRRCVHEDVDSDRARANAAPDADCCVDVAA